MSGPQFFETRAGREFYQGTMPALLRELQRLNELLAAHLELRSEPPTKGERDGRTKED
ncbi:MAG: hypothetical protein ACI9UU_003019 [Candidatus Azotimanducaceae bacterium]|jgi:hypothetical protein